MLEDKIGLETVPFSFPSFAKQGQRITSTFGMVYEFDGVQWNQIGSAPTASSYVFRIGIDETTPGTVDVIPATTLEIGGLYEAPADGQSYVRQGGAWVPSAAGTAYIFDVGLTEAPPGTVNLDAATNAIIGGIMEPPPDALTYVRTYAGSVGAWVPTAAGTAYTWGIGIDEVPPGSGTIDLIAATATVLGGVSVVARSLTQGLNLDPLGALTAPVATDLLAGSIVEPPPDGLSYARSRSTVGASTWVPVSGVFIGDAPPPAPTLGQFWWESDSGKLFLYVNDGNSSQFVQVGGP